ncbi:MAG TPA: sulfite exporter TauE/SafE family protein [Bacillota bacterium]|nr:sulfite exporter TauE/SafE family protein [Bacillota bacterium]
MDVIEVLGFSALGLCMGTLSGLGLGGGKILIPVLVLFTTVNQAQAQGITLLSFIPIAIVAIMTHMKEKNIDWSLVGWVVVGGGFGSLCGSIVAMKISLEHLRTVFGIFLIALGIFEWVVKDHMKKRFTH